MENELYKSKSGQGVANLLWYSTVQYWIPAAGVQYSTVLYIYSIIIIINGLLQYMQGELQT